MEDLIVPGAGSVARALAKILQLCSQMKEGQEACARLHARLQDVFDQLRAMEKRGELPRSNALDKYVVLITQYLEYLQRYSAKPLVSRLVRHWKMIEELRAIQEDVVALFRMLNLAATATMMDWRKQWEADRAAQERALTDLIGNDVAVLRELQDTRAQVEAVLLLKFEMERRAERQSDEMIRLMKRMTVTVVRASHAVIKALPPWFLPSDEVEFEPKPFACGSFGSVHRGVWGVGAGVVVKCLLIDGPQMDERAQQRVESEIDIWHRFNHPNVIKMFGASHVSSPPFIVCEDATKGNLCSFLARSEANKRHMWRLLYQAGLGLDYVHRNNVVHGDLKLNNILVGADGLAKLSDFGLSALRSCSSMSKTRVSAAPVSGGLRWRAPECLRRRPNFASDVYSFAMCMIEAAIGEPPFAFLDDDAVRQTLKDGEIPEQPDEMSEEEWELVVAMTDVDPKLRLPLPRVLDKLKEFAKLGETPPAEKEQEVTRCRVCSSIIMGDFAFCGRCGTSVEPVWGEGPAVNDPPRRRVLINSSSSVAVLLVAIASGDSVERELALSILARKCLEAHDDPFKLQDDDIQALADVVKAVKPTTYSSQLHALECLRFARDITAQFPVFEFRKLRNCVREPTSHDISTLMALLKAESASKKDDAAVLCGCLSALGNQRELLEAGSLPTLVGMVVRGSDTQKQWAAYALGNLALDNPSQANIVGRGAVPPLVMLLQQGTTTQATCAVFALGELARNNKPICEVMTHVGVVAALEERRWHGSMSLRKIVASVLRNLEEWSAEQAPSDSASPSVQPPSSSSVQLAVRSKASWKTSLKRFFRGVSSSSDDDDDDFLDFRPASEEINTNTYRTLSDTRRTLFEQTLTRTRSTTNATGSIAHRSRRSGSEWEDPVIVAARVPFDRVMIGDLLGKGAYGEVFRGEFRDQEVAVKKLLPDTKKNMKHISEFLSEIRLLAAMEHPHIVHFVGVAWDALSDLMCLTEFIAGGDLRSLLIKYHDGRHPLGFDAQKATIALHIAHALTYLHSLRPLIIHRDLKSRNILLTNTLEAKLTDFGVSRERSDRTMTAGVGSCLWMAPEVMMGRRYDEKADVFSLGIVLSELDTHELPYSHANDNQTGAPMMEMAVLQQVSAGRLSVQLSDRLQPSLRYLVTACVGLDPRQRPTAAQALNELQVISRSLK